MPFIRTAFSTLLPAVSMPALAAESGSVVVGGLNTQAIPTFSPLILSLAAVALLFLALYKIKGCKTLTMLAIVTMIGTAGVYQQKLIASVTDLVVSSTSPACAGGSETLSFDSNSPPQLTNECATAIEIKHYSLPCSNEIWEGSATAGTLLGPGKSVQLLSCGDFAPEFTLPSSVSVPEDAGPQVLAGWVTNISPGPASESGQTVSFGVATDTPSLFSVQPAISSDGTLTFTGADNAFGSSIVTVTATDSAGSTSSQTFVLNIAPVNDAPAFNLAMSNISILEDNGQDLNTDKTGDDFDTPPNGSNYTQVSIANVATNIDTGSGEDQQIPDFTVTFIQGTRSDANRVVNLTAEDIFYSGEIEMTANGALEFKLNPHHWGEVKLGVVLEDGEGGVTAPQTLTLSVAPVWDNEPTGATASITGDENSACIPLNLIGNSYRDLSQPVFKVTALTLDAGKSGTLYQDGDAIEAADLPFETTSNEFCFVPATSQYSDFDFTFGTFDLFATLRYQVWSGLGNADTGESPAVPGQSTVFNELSQEYQVNITVNPVF
ncbi:hypothetical protein ABIE61_003532 [Marinobacterium sp. MBR-111]|uniref:hypothetical protein n=1 Tax=Marinobacterium sp. MBR-111 TaxID=3156463 RepID=UPI003397EDE4